MARASATFGELQREMAARCSHLFIDEAHHVGAPTWETFKRSFGSVPIIQFAGENQRAALPVLIGQIVFSVPSDSVCLQIDTAPQSARRDFLFDFSRSKRFVKTERSASSGEKSIFENASRQLDFRIGIRAEIARQNYFPEIRFDPLVPNVTTVRVNYSDNAGEVVRTRTGEFSRSAARGMVFTDQLALLKSGQPWVNVTTLFVPL
jgi:hypothetical protein